MILLMNESEGLFNYKERYQLFNNPEEAIIAAKKLGFQTFISPDFKPGMLNLCQCGDVNIKLINIIPK